MSSLHSARIVNEFPEFSDEQYPGNLYYNEEHNVYVLTFENLYEEEEVNIWVPQQIIHENYTFVKVNDERFYAKSVHTANKIHMKLKGNLPIVNDGWLTIPAEFTIPHEEPLPADTNQITQNEVAWNPINMDPVPSLLANLFVPTPEPLLQTALRLLRWEHPPTVDPSLLLWDLAPSCQAISLKPTIPPHQKRIADVMISDAVSKGGCCPISMNPLTQSSAACVAPCYHIFEKEAIQTWLGDHTTCPECRQPCSL